MRELFPDNIVSALLVNADREFLEGQLSHRRWLRCRVPFPHVKAEDVLRPALYQEVSQSFTDLLNAGRAIDKRQGVKRQGVFAKSIPNYDVQVAKIPGNPNHPLQFFQSRAWCNLIANLFGVTFTGDVNVELHHHQKGSANGGIHNDLNPGWFVGEASATETNIADNSLCSYRYGHCNDPFARPRQVVRGAALIYYLANPAWRAGAGGETGLYETASDALETPTVAVPPINNSLIAFECTPYSFHAFLSNTVSERNAIVLWVHRTREDADARWGQEAIINWPANPKSVGP